jgi:hypothetical protein
MEIIGSTYNKLANFLKTNAPAETQPAPAEGGAEVTDSAEQA